MKLKSFKQFLNEFELEGEHQENKTFYGEVIYNLQIPYHSNVDINDDDFMDMEFVETIRDHNVTTFDELGINMDERYIKVHNKVINFNNCSKYCDGIEYSGKLEDALINDIKETGRWFENQSPIHNNTYDYMYGTMNITMDLDNVEVNIIDIKH